MFTRYEFQIDDSGHRKRIDEFLFDQFSELGKKYLRRMIKDDKCEINGYVANAGIVLKKNDFVELEIDFSNAKRMRPEKIELDIVFEDPQIIVVNKPSGILVHPTPKHRSGTLLNALTYHLNQESIETHQANSNTDITSNLRSNNNLIRPGLVHRLDKQTSGLLLVAKTRKALKILNGQFKRKTVEKKYLAMLEGAVSEDSGRIEAPIGRYDELRHWNVKLDGKASETYYRVLERYSDKTLVELEPITGRTNQLRIHCAYIGHPILGDEWHGTREFPRLCLHASSLSFRHPLGEKQLRFDAEVDFDLNAPFVQ